MPTRAITMSKLVIIALLLATTFSVAPVTRTAEAAIKTPGDKFVRTANYYLRAGTDITPSLYPELAKFDLLVFPVEAQHYNRAMFAELRRLNPTIIILAYVPSKSWNYSWNDPVHDKLEAGIQDSWWLTDPQGNRVSVWPGTSVINGVSGWNDYLPRFVKNEVMSTGLWDGVFYDEFSASASWINGGNIDIQRSGKRDDPRLADVAWQRAMVNLLKLTRELLGNEAVIVTNGDSTDALQPYVNGRMFESFPTPWEAGGTWTGVMANYVNLHRSVGHTPVFIINGTTDNTGNNVDYRKVRFGVASTLLADGFFSFDFGETDHGQLWHYDEQSVHLGRPLGGPVNVQGPSDANIRPGVWRRDFADGVALVNSTGQAQTVSLGGELEKIRGTQDPSVNNGAIVTSVVLQPNDGLLLMKRIEKLQGAVFPNGAFVRLFDSTGISQRNGFFSYDSAADGNASVASIDIDLGTSGNESGVEKITAANGRVTVFNANGSTRLTFAPYGDAYRGPINLAVGDLDTDGRAEIVTGAGPGGGPQVRVFNRDGKALGPGFFAFDRNFRGGVSVAIGNVYGTTRPVIVTGAGPGGGPQVRVFSKTGQAISSFFAYDSRFRGGVNVAVGDLNGDGRAEIVTGAGPGGGPHVRIFDGWGKANGKGFFAADPASRTGVRVAVTDTNGDGISEIATYTTDVFQFAATAAR